MKRTPGTVSRGDVRSLLIHALKARNTKLAAACDHVLCKKQAFADSLPCDDACNADDWAALDQCLEALNE